MIKYDLSNFDKNYEILIRDRESKEIYQTGGELEKTLKSLIEKELKISILKINNGLFRYIDEYKKRYTKKRSRKDERGIHQKAHYLVSMAIKDNELKKEYECSKCKSNYCVIAHHDDYSKPLSVRWLCRRCHSEYHKLNDK